MIFPIDHESVRNVYPILKHTLHYPNQGPPVSAVLVIEADGLVVGQTCTTTVFVATIRAPGRGRSERHATFEPSNCLTGISDGGTPITDTMTLNPGLKLFDGTTNDLLAGPKDSIQLTPIGCP